MVAPLHSRFSAWASGSARGVTETSEASAGGESWVQSGAVRVVAVSRLPGDAHCHGWLTGAFAWWHASGSTRQRLQLPCLRTSIPRSRIIECPTSVAAPPASPDGQRACCPRVAPRRRRGTLFGSLLLLRAGQKKGLWQRPIRAAARAWSEGGCVTPAAFLPSPVTGRPGCKKACHGGGGGMAAMGPQGRRRRAAGLRTSVHAIRSSLLLHRPHLAATISITTGTATRAPGLCDPGHISIRPAGSCFCGNGA